MKVVDFIATRNVVAHNRGRVDDSGYMQAVRDSPFAVGTVRSLIPDDVWACAFSLTEHSYPHGPRCCREVRIDEVVLAEIWSPLVARRNRRILSVPGVTVAAAAQDR